MSKAKVLFRVCICGHHAWYRNSIIATIAKDGSFHWEVSNVKDLPGYVLAEVSTFAAGIAKTV